MLGLIEKQIGPHRVAVFILNNTDTQLELLRLAARDEDGNPMTDPAARLREEATLRERRAEAVAKIGAANIDADAVAKLCDQVIDVARQEIQGH